jgi:hypothetical protein
MAVGKEWIDGGERNDGENIWNMERIFGRILVGHF